MATEPTVTDDTAPMQEEFPLTLLLGDGMSTRVLNTLIRTEGRYTLTISEVCDRVNAETEQDVEEVVAMLNRLLAIDAISQPTYGCLLYHPSHDALKHMSEADDQMVAKLYPDSWFAEVVQSEG